MGLFYGENMGLAESGQSYKKYGDFIGVITRSYEHGIAEGDVANHTLVRVIGTNDSVGTSFETVSEVQGLLTYLSSAERLKIKSSDADDDGDPAGNGAQTLKIWGLDGSYVEQNETVTLNGTTAVTTVNSYLRIYKAEVVASGSTGTNEGVISINNNADDTTLLKILASHGGSTGGTFTVPAGQTLTIKKWWANAVSNQDVQVHLFVRNSGESWVSKDEMALNNCGFTVDTGEELQVQAQADVEFRALSSASTSIVHAAFSGWYET